MWPFTTQSLDQSKPFSVCLSSPPKKKTFHTAGGLVVKSFAQSYMNQFGLGVLWCCSNGASNTGWKNHGPSLRLIFFWGAGGLGNEFNSGRCGKVYKGNRATVGG